MISVEELLQPISADYPSGANPRSGWLYDEIQEARREDLDVDQGVWQNRRKQADYPLVISISTHALKTRTKDLRIAAWLTEALLHQYGFRGLTSGFELLHGLLEKFWDTVYPAIEDGDLEPRAAVLDWVGDKLEIPVRGAPLNGAGHTLQQYIASHQHAWEDQRAWRRRLIQDAVPAPEILNRSFVDTPRSFYVDLEHYLATSLVSLEHMKTFCDARFGDDAPSFWRLERALLDFRHFAHALLETNKPEAAAHA